MQIQQIKISPTCFFLIVTYFSSASNIIGYIYTVKYTVLYNIAFYVYALKEKLEISTTEINNLKNTMDLPRPPP